MLAAAKPHFPQSLVYAGKPIDSLCFSNPEKTIDLRRCGAEHEKYIVKNARTDLNKKGYIGYEWTDSSMPSGPQGYSYYKYFSAGNNQFWIYAINNGGGSGNFTSLYLVKRLNASALNVQAIAAGDRCNGGIQDVAVRNHELTFSVNLTPYDLVALAHSQTNNLKAYDDLAACAVCCTARAFYSTDISTRLGFSYAGLDKINSASEMPEQGRYQACFNKLLFSYIKKNKIMLNSKEVDAFVDQFKHVCIP
jgi:hypothetical protein